MAKELYVIKKNLFTDTLTCGDYSRLVDYTSFTSPIIAICHVNSEHYRGRQKVVMNLNTNGFKRSSCFVYFVIVCVYWNQYTHISTHEKISKLFLTSEAFENNISENECIVIYPSNASKITEQSFKIRL